MEPIATTPALPRILDFSDFIRGGPKASRFCRQLAAHLETFGFARLINHPITPEQLAKTFDMSRKFFRLPLAQKMIAAHPEQPNPHRGFSHVGLEHISGISGFEKGILSGAQVEDVKETFDQGPADDMQFPNRWPDQADLPQFRDHMEGLFDSCHAALCQVLSAIEKALGLPEQSFENLHSERHHELRLLHYPAVPRAELANLEKTRIAEHTDFGSITLLFEDSTGGLEFEDQCSPGSFIAVHAPYPELLINVGDSLMRWTNRSLTSACHRVTAPQAGQQGLSEIVPERFSVAFFGKANRQASLAPLPKFVTESSPSLFEDVTAGQYNQWKLTRTYH